LFPIRKLENHINQISDFRHRMSDLNSEIWNLISGIYLHTNTPQPLAVVRVNGDLNI